jgi:hypothetical protein
MGDSQQGETQNRQQKSKNSYDEKSARKHRHHPDNCVKTSLSKEGYFK